MKAALLSPFDPLTPLAPLAPLAPEELTVDELLPHPETSRTARTAPPSDIYARVPLTSRIKVARAPRGRWSSHGDISAGVRPSSPARKAAGQGLEPRIP